MTHSHPPLPSPVLSRLRRRPAALVLAVIACALTAGCDKTSDAALSLSTGGAVDTDYPIAQIQGHESSLSLRFMLAFPNSYENVLIGESGTGVFKIAKDGSGSGQMDVPRLAVHLGSAYAWYEHPTDAQGLRASTWYSLTVTIDGSRKVKVYLDGAEARRTDGAGSPVMDDLVVPATEWATGHLRFGQRNAAMAKPEQFYGLIDDVAIWDHVLTSGELDQLEQHPKLTGAEAGLLAGWNFDVLPSGTQPLPKHARPLTWTPEAQHGWPLIAGQSWPDVIIPSNEKTKYALPLTGAWKVIQGADSPPRGSHRGYASFCLDLVSDDSAQPTRGSEVHAVADGTVVFIRDTSPDAEPDQKVPGCTPCPGDDASCNYLANEVTLQHAEGEYTEYLHLEPGSVPDAIKDKLVSGAVVMQGELLGRVGRSGTGGDHLHFAQMWKFVPAGENGAHPGKDVPKVGSCGYTPAVPRADGLTRPFVFDDFRIKRGGLGGFEPALRELPHKGDVIMPPL